MVESNTIVIKQLRKQLFLMSLTMNQHQPCTFVQKIIQNSKNDSHCQAITTQCVKAIIDPFMYVSDEPRNDIVDIVEAPKEKSEKLVTRGDSP